MITKEDLAQAILELKESQEQISRELKESQEQMARELKESDLKLKKVQEQMAHELKTLQEEISRDLKQSSLELKASQEKSDRRLDRVSQMLGSIGNNQGDVAEEFFVNSLKAKPILNSIQYDFVESNAHRKRSNIEDEFDILLVNGRDVAIIETKYKAHTTDIEKLINKKYENFKKLYPEYRDYNHHLGFASFNINEDVKELALQNSVMLLQRKGDIIETIAP